MENKYKHMDYIQSAISRMASNSFYLKGWNVTIIAAIVALSFKESDWRIYACALVLNFVFWFLDAYYLKQEKLFRELYNKVSMISDCLLYTSFGGTEKKFQFPGALLQGFLSLPE